MVPYYETKCSYLGIGIFEEAGQQKYVFIL